MKTPKPDTVTITCLNCVHIHSWTVKRGADISEMRCPEMREREVREIEEKLEGK